MDKQKIIKQLRIGLVMTTYNRIEYLQRTIKSIEQSIFPECCHLLIYDDASEKQTKEYIQGIMLNIECTKIFANANHGVEYGLSVGLNFFKQMNYDIYCIIDSDVEFNKGWLVRLLELYKRSKDQGYIYSGFNANNTHRHKSIHTGKDFYLKNTIGGLNMLFDEKNYDLVMNCLSHKKRWDWQVCKEYAAKEKVFVVTKPSVLQHIGINSSINHANADIATDFVK